VQESSEERAEHAIAEEPARRKRTADRLAVERKGAPIKILGPSGAQYPCGRDTRAPRLAIPLITAN
jgi:hypothetical protein